MKLLVTGAQGFIGKNLIATLKYRGYDSIMEFNSDNDPTLLQEYTKQCDFVFHLAGANRPPDLADFMKVNHGLTDQLVEALKRNQRNCPIIFTSSTQASLDNPYGLSKRSAEDIISKYAIDTGAKVLIYRLPNVFGKWCKPNYNSVIATFCHHIAHGLPIQINDPIVELNLIYIDDVVQEFIQALQDQAHRSQQPFCEIPTVYQEKLGDIADLIYTFRNSREARSIPDMSNAFTKKLYSTYLSYLPTREFLYPLKMNVDDRGSFTEFIKTVDRGQVSVNISKPGITKGNHWHHSKNEKFLVVSGHGVIRFRKIGESEIIAYYVSGDKLEVVDIPTGYTHHIENLGNTDMVTIMWVNEPFDPDTPDTYFMEV
jgi:UDP-2-acetamido-2,6-beta-L-arabino-hexul-4-ose reductase